MFSLCDQINFKSKRNKLSSSLHSSCHFVSRVCAKTNEAIWYAKIGGWFHSSSSSWGRTWAFSWRWASPRVNTQSNLISGTLPSSTRECAERDLSPSWGENPSLVIRSGKPGQGERFIHSMPTGNVLLISGKCDDYLFLLNENYHRFPTFPVEENKNNSPNLPSMTNLRRTSTLEAFRANKNKNNEWPHFW